MNADRAICAVSVIRPGTATGFGIAVHVCRSGAVRYARPTAGSPGCRSANDTLRAIPVLSCISATWCVLVFGLARLVRLQVAHELS